MSMESRSMADSGRNPMGTSHDLDESALRDVRRLVRGLLTGHTGTLVDDAVLVSDELVSNARRHGTAPRAYRLALVNDRQSFRIEVDDASHDEPRIRVPDRTGGRGLILVNRLASSWGFDHAADHKTVWAELALDQQTSGGRARHLTSAPTWPQA